ncbi:DUF1345 domain-containing protein [Nocardia yamanashiensis]|uniref:DUF1345 domain-containing protein n=1 Tax=Nocardia yamanashiensis TaxID=209247 RepID=UPI001E5B3A6E|nr:DUF1345 domain-containing protein [Nocardia yamanashiensis]UGT44196.1 DUF1345 domain-containing protein [Nocardia yamanashiensis]
MRKLLWALELILAILGVAWLTLFLRDEPVTAPLLAWNIVAVVYMAAGWTVLRRELPAQPVDDIAELSSPRWYTQFFAVLVSCFGLAGGLIVGTARDDVHADGLLQGLAAATIVLSWFLLHSAFAQIYARENTAEGGLDFPNCPLPQFTEFFYFAITIGTSFAVSDVTVTTRSMRRRVIVHSIVSFFFNAALIAIAIDWIKS